MSDVASSPGSAASDEGTDAVDATEAVSATDAEPTFSVMLLGAVTFELPSPAPVVSLIEQAVPYREIEIPIGLPEAQALAQAQHDVKGARPGTHELFSEALRHAQTDIVAVRIIRYEAGIFYAELDLMTPRGRAVLDSRVTDAIILAVRQPVSAPILCDVNVLSAIAGR